MWFLTFFLLIVFSWVLIKEVHPIRLAGAVLVMSLIGLLSLCFFIGPVFAVCSFLVMVGGVLVVFGYSVSLVPLESQEKVKVQGSSSLIGIFLSFFFFLVLVLPSVSEFSGDLFGFFFVSDCLYFSDSWGKMVSLLGFYLFLGMVVAVRICSSYKGALVR
uniref:NADH dehydrogenase subunit 6 n=1 Tax=Lutraria maxima TaxID=971267 RepID=A0A343S4M9_9BIVA|nr:NADH dehydrogenase subunit 6 [Lutraria maxima]AUH21195.1 NADH dehydrogenase subunit 6 [Lutraria maxima]